MVLRALAEVRSGEIFMPKIPFCGITDVAQAISPDWEHPIVCIHPGEKAHEEMITACDSSKHR